MRISVAEILGLHILCIYDNTVCILDFANIQKREIMKLILIPYQQNHFQVSILNRFYTYYLMVIILFLIVLAAGQQCPYCEWNACSITSQGLANCSSCNQGALVPVISGETPAIVNDFGPDWSETIGVCMLCPTGCSACAYGGFGGTMGPPSVGIYCTSCNTGYYSISQGSCAACPANCQACTYGGFGTSVSCTTCSSGYTLQTSGCVLDSTAALAGGPEETSTSMVTVGLASWGVVMTLVAAVFVGLWVKNRNKVSSLGMLNVELAVARNSN